MLACEVTLCSCVLVLFDSQIMSAAEAVSVEANCRDWGREDFKSFKSFAIWEILTDVRLLGSSSSHRAFPKTAVNGATKCFGSMNAFLQYLDLFSVAIDVSDGVFHLALRSMLLRFCKCDADFVICLICLVLSFSILCNCVVQKRCASMPNGRTDVAVAS